MSNNTVHIRFKVNYYTRLGQEVYICGSSEELGNWVDAEAKKLRYGDNGDWEIIVEFKKTSTDQVLNYKYFIMDTNADKIWEGGPNRTLDVSICDPFYTHEVRDTYQSPSSAENTFLKSSFFRDVYFRRTPEDVKTYNHIPTNSKDKVVVRFQVKSTCVTPHHSVYIVGSNTTLGNWRTERAIRLADDNYPNWRVDLEFTKDQLPFSYKYIITDDTTKSHVHWEQGSDRWFTSSILHASDYSNAVNEDRVYFFNDGDFKESNLIRTSGVAVPVFSLRSKKGLGVGEFNDIKALIDWASATGMHMIQILPINDTSVYYTWRDSYPYSSVSVFALHPIYINIESVSSDPEILSIINQHRDKLNALPHIDYESVITLKLDLLNKIYGKEKSKLATDKGLFEFVQENAKWIKPYALYMVLREQFKSSDHFSWPEHKSIDKETIEKLTSKNEKYWEKVQFYYFVQYHLHLQLLSASRYAVENRIGLKGDLPIGVSRQSVDTWVEPELFRLNMSTGAPPDAFADDGQNWGFPTYDWDRMKLDNYGWWRARLGQMSKYFHAYRIDHILGFFRIWEIPTEQLTGLLGHFNPSLPLWRSELSNNGIWDLDRLTKPYIRYHTLREQFGEYSDTVAKKFLKEYSPNCFKLLPQFETERLIDTNLEKDDQMYKPGLLKLVQNVSLLKDQDDENRYYPRIEINKTTSFNELSDDLKATLYRMYISYYFERQEELWTQIGMQRLPAIRDCTRMLVCGEDLGMVPKCVEPTLKNLGILGLRIQRMPSESAKEFYHPSEYSYLTVNTTSSHDMSTLRGWWEEDRTRSQNFYNNILGMYGEAPYFCEPYVTEAVIVQHLQSQSMISIFPLQDWFGLSSELSSRDPKEEKINEPSNPFHYWRYRCHVNLEDLLENQEFNKTIQRLIISSNRKLEDTNN
ncbi:4-alpha-glucanotransferase [Cavenderia fasciculata]|uniref:4-alpha-glucanotransferase n=1 Tax=Cavenderia fasciculata TaxID=261658 RepID=F4PRX9_CACFS|nr:4-alpha-glucanotransferase [Cavenderia fasciculata]EGG21415.1 4-alpha-glucanotransferase [Cavenderia fasciculata]|eukprot:XP_004359265.1 4-alpha-glucanotransferase [Cavenderia fasciculata]